MTADTYTEDCTKTHSEEDCAYALARAEAFNAQTKLEVAQMAQAEREAELFGLAADIEHAVSVATRLLDNAGEHEMCDSARLMVDAAKLALDSAGLPLFILTAELEI